MFGNKKLNFSKHFIFYQPTKPADRETEQNFVKHVGNSPSKHARYRAALASYPTHRPPEEALAPRLIPEIYSPPFSTLLSAPRLTYSNHIKGSGLPSLCFSAGDDLMGLGRSEEGSQRMKAGDPSQCSLPAGHRDTAVFLISGQLLCAAPSSWAPLPGG